MFATSSSLTFIVCAILLFISARRTGLDRPAHYLIIIFSVIACALSLCLIGGTALHANKICISPRTAKCTLQAALIHIFLVLIALLGSKSTKNFQSITLFYFSDSMHNEYLRQLPLFETTIKSDHKFHLQMLDN